MAGALIEPDLSHQKLKLEHTEIAQKIFIELVIGCSTSVFGGIPPFSEFPKSDQWFYNPKVISRLC